MRYTRITDQIKLSICPKGPLTSHLAPFTYYLEGKGYKPSSIQSRSRLSAAFSLWLEERNIETTAIQSDHIEGYIQYRAHQGKSCHGVRAALGQMLEFLCAEGILPEPNDMKAPQSPAEAYLYAYEGYLRTDRALAESSIVSYIACIRPFLEGRFGNGAIKPSDLCAWDIVKFIRLQASHLGPKRAKLTTCAVRSFLNYARYCGDIEQDLTTAVPSVANWSMPSIPRAITTDQVDQLLDSIDLGTPAGLRDYAIVLLLARLGLRACEIAFLELDYIDWNAGILTICKKGGYLSKYPMSGEVGRALAAYLQNGRPSHASRYVFLRTVAPIGPFRGASSIGAVIKHRLERTTIQAPTKGAHQFRHGLATDMLSKGASLGEIGDLLGHHHPSSTMIYIKSDIEKLRTLAMPWPGERL